MEAVLTLSINNQIRERKRGNLLFAPGSILGTAIFPLSRLVSAALAQDKKVALRINFLLHFTKQELSTFF